jgi:CHAT domain-containing protein
MNPTVAQKSGVDILISDWAPTQSLTDNAPQLVQQGKEHYQAGQFADALTNWQHAADTFAAQGDTLNQAMVLSNLALVHQQLGRWDEAKAAIEKSLKLLGSEKRGAASDRLKILAQALNNQGILYLAQGQSQQAFDTWQKATNTYRQIGDESGVIRSLINQAQALRALGFYRRARNTLEQVQQALEKQPDSLMKAAGLRSLGDVLRLLGELSPSRQSLEDSLAMTQHPQSPQQRQEFTATLLSLGNTAYSQYNNALALQQPQEAQEFFEKAQSSYQQAAENTDSPTTRFQAQLNELNLLLNAKQERKNRELRETEQEQRIRALLPQLKSQVANLPSSRSGLYAQINLAQNLSRLHQISPQEAPSWSEIAQLLNSALQQAQTLQDEQVVSYTLGYLGHISEQTQQWTEARNLTERALNLAQAINAQEIAYRWLWQLGRLSQSQGEPQQAVCAYTEAVNTLKSLRTDLVAIDTNVQFSFRDSVEPVYRDLVSLLLQYQPQNPPCYSQKSGEFKGKEYNYLEQAREVLELLQLAELNNFFREACQPNKPKPLAEIDPNAAVIYPIILPDRLEVILSLPKQPLRHYSTNTAEKGIDVEKTLREMRNSFRRVAFETEYLPLVQKVYNLLIRPAEIVLAESEVKTLVFVLDGALRNLPMAALHDGQHYLVEKYNIALAPGLQLLAPQSPLQEQIEVLMAGLSEERGGFKQLPGVELELDQISSELSSAQLSSELLLNQKFTKENLQNQLKKNPFPVVHLATHGRFSSNPEDTFILTGDIPPNDSKIRAKEFEMLLRSREQDESYPLDLLVLSACQTAQGDNRAALGLAGLAVRSGALSTLATLWLVEDKSTAELMVQFYQELIKPNVTKAMALRHAQLTLLKGGYEHPFYWAPFVLVGNWL